MRGGASSALQSVKMGGREEGGGEKQAKPGGRKERKRGEGLFTTDVNWAPPPPPRCQPALLPFFFLPALLFPSILHLHVAPPFLFLVISLLLDPPSGCRIAASASSVLPPLTSTVASQSPPPPPKKKNNDGEGGGGDDGFVRFPTQKEKEKEKEKKVEAAHSRVCKSWCSVYCAIARIHFFSVVGLLQHTTAIAQSKSKSVLFSLSRLRRSSSSLFLTHTTQRARPKKPLPPSSSPFPPVPCTALQRAVLGLKSTIFVVFVSNQKLKVTSKNTLEFSQRSSWEIIVESLPGGGRSPTYPPSSPLFPPSVLGGGGGGGRGGERTEEAEAKPPFPILLPLSVAALSLPFPHTSRSLTPPPPSLPSFLNP